MKILIIGGTGIISSAITRQLAASGHDLWLLNRGTRKAEVPANVHQIIADIADEASVLAALPVETFDAEVIEYTVAPGAAITEGPIKDIDFPRNAIIGGVIRGSESFIAVGDTRIEPYDRVAVFALPDTVKEVDKFFK